MRMENQTRYCITIRHSMRLSLFRINGRLTPNDKDFYIMELENGVFVDGKFRGNNSRFINHSCAPNCELVRWIVKGMGGGNVVLIILNMLSYIVTKVVLALVYLL